MPRDSIILGMADYRIHKVYGGDPVFMDISYKGDACCPFCTSSRLRAKSRYIRQIRHTNMGHRPTYLRLEGRKYLCKDCGRYFNQRFPGILPRRRSTEVYRRHVFINHLDGVCSKTLAERERIGSATIERWYHDLLGKKVSERKNEPCPEMLGIDEHFFTRRQGYATTLCDLKHRKIYDITLGRSESSLDSYLSRLKGRENVKLICMDLSVTYRSIARKYFPNAVIVADRFHVIKLINHHFLKAWRTLDPVASRNRGMLSLMRRHEKNLKPEQKERMRTYLAQRPDLEIIYRFKQELCTMLTRKTCNEKTCREMIVWLKEDIRMLKDSPLEQLNRLGNTLESWIEEIVRMWRYTKNNGITEGYHNKMKMIVRRAFGFRNFENYRLRVRALCA